MIAKVGTNSYIDIDAISYIEGLYQEDELVGVQLIVRGESLTFTNPKVAGRVMESYLWHNQHSIYNMIEDTDGYRKKIRS